jgi:hypothetical protein
MDVFSSSKISLPLARDENSRNNPTEETPKFKLTNLFLPYTDTFGGVYESASKTSLNDCSSPKVSKDLLSAKYNSMLNRRVAKLTMSLDIGRPNKLGKTKELLNL